MSSSDSQAVQELIAESWEFIEGKAESYGYTLIRRLADALEAATSEPGEDYREALARVKDTLAYYHCRSVNPKADHPRMGYHAMTEDQREHLREKQSEAAEEIMRMVPSLSRAAVPDAATERVAERDAALAAIERVAKKIEAVAGGTTTSSEAAGYRNGLLRAAQIVRAALDGAPEPEWEERLAACDEHGTHCWSCVRYTERRRPAGEWHRLPVEGEKP